MVGGELKMKMKEQNITHHNLQINVKKPELVGFAGIVFSG